MTSTKSNYILSPLWQQAVVAGTFWGALEIILGSVLHNLMLPLIAGTLLSFAGVMIMTAISIGKPQRGLYWRAALVCAMLKSVSPSAVIIPPMIGIMLEGAFMEIGVLLLGANVWGLMFGGGFAVLSVPIFKISRLFMMYGSSIYDLYVSVFGGTIKNYNQQAASIWPIVTVTVIYFIFGAVAVLLGYMISRNIKQANFDIGRIDAYENDQKSAEKSFIPILNFFLHLVFLIIFLSFTSKMPTYVSLTLAGFYILLTTLLYPRARFPFKKWSVWLPILVFSFAVPIISVGSLSDIRWLEGGSKILMRAMLVVVSFAAIGSELGKPGVKAIFAGGFFQPAYVATSIAFNSLPNYMDRIKKFELRGRNPIAQIRNLISDTLSIKHSIAMDYPIVIVTGERGEGKTTFVKEVIEAMKNQKIKYSGFYALGLGDNSLRSGYNLVLLPENKNMKFCYRVSKCGTPQKSFEFDYKSIAIGEELLDTIPQGVVIVIDEIGKLELDGEVWNKAFTQLVQRNTNPLIITVRRANLQNVIAHWNMANATVVDISSGSVTDVINALLKK